MASTKQETLEKLLDEPHRLPLPVFAKLCSSGIPEGPSHALRARCWLLLLGVVDARQEKDTYDSQLKQSRENYCEPKPLTEETNHQSLVPDRDAFRRRSGSSQQGY